MKFSFIVSFRISRGYKKEKEKKTDKKIMWKAMRLQISRMRRKNKEKAMQIFCLHLRTSQNMAKLKIAFVRHKSNNGDGEKTEEM